jgi:hypothetical protein
MTPEQQQQLQSKRDQAAQKMTPEQQQQLQGARDQAAQRQGMTPEQRTADRQQQFQGMRDSAASRQATTPAAQRSQESPRWASVSPDTQRQLNHDAAARQQGAWREQARSQAGSRSWGAGGARLGGHRH